MLMKKKVLPILLLIPLIIVPIVYAGEIFDVFYYTFSGYSAGDIYYQYQGWIEFFIYLAIFVSLIMGVFKERFGKKQTKTIAIAMGTALSLALASFYPGLIEGLGPIAFLIFVALFWYFIFASLKESFENEWLAMAVSYIISFGLLWLVDPQGRLQSYVYSVPGIGWIADVLIILFVIAAIIIILKLKEKYLKK
jgi:hypothetical protein